MFATGHVVIEPESPKHVRLPAIFPGSIKLWSIDLRWKNKDKPTVLRTFFYFT